MQRKVLLSLLTLVIVLTMAAPAMATTPPSTNYATSQGFTATLDAADAGTYQISLMGSLDFATYQANQSVSSQSPLSIYNGGTRSFYVYVSADNPPSYMGMYKLWFSDYPGQDQVRWTLTPQYGPEMSVSDQYATSFGSIDPGNSMTLYSTLYMGSGITYPGQYSWTGTVYAVPTS